MTEAWSLAEQARREGRIGDAVRHYLAAAIDAHRSGDMAAAEHLYRTVLAEGENVVAMTNLGSLLRSTGRKAEAESLLRRALQIEPDRPTTRLNLANLLATTDQLHEAAQLYRSVMARIPEARFELANVLLALGQDAEGWSLYGDRPQRTVVLRTGLSFPEWRGEPLTGKRLLVRPEQGFGDQLLAARYLSAVGTRCRVTCYVQAPLLRLFAQLPVEVRELGTRDVPVEPHDYWSLPLSLPLWVAPAEIPYLAASARETGRKVGVAWQGNALPDPARSIPEAEASALLDLPGAMCLHPAPGQDFQTTAELIAGLDLVISIDTSVAHLAGAMGKPLWVLLHHGSRDWRWRAQDPFYRDVRIFRQPAPGDWASVLAEVEEALGRSAITPPAA